jgi:hypothetical protein
MAGCWFKRIAAFGKKELAALQSDMSNVTFIGEFVGHPDCQHLVLYPNEAIVFYAIVDNNSSETSIVVEAAIDTF